MSNEQRYIPTLDGWRAVAILGVVFAHGSFSMSQFLGFQEPWWLIFGSHGVALFFGLSGFLICTRLLQEQEKTSTLNIKTFYIRRVFRILPPMLVYLGFLSILGVLGALPISVREIVASLFFYRNYIVEPPIYGSGYYTLHFWSLSVEEHFYLLWPCLLLLVGNKRALWLTIFLILSVTVWRNLDFRYHILHERYLDPEVLGHRSDLKLDALLGGCLLAILLQYQTARVLLQKLLPNFVILALSVLYFAILIRDPHFSALMRVLIIPLIIVGTVLSPKSLLSRFLEMRWMRWIGRLSYSIYIWQELFQVMGLVKRPLPFGALQEFPLSLVCVLVFSCLSYYLIEKRLVRLGHRLTKTGGRPVAPKESPQIGATP
jgi:peptidoglycan/LPS O-acetylase OafA/YrhL